MKTVKMNAEHVTEFTAISKTTGNPYTGHLYKVHATDEQKAQMKAIDKYYREDEEGFPIMMSLTDCGDFAVCSLGKTRDRVTKELVDAFRISKTEKTRMMQKAYDSAASQAFGTPVLNVAPVVKASSIKVDATPEFGD